jgi:hypothetical protein
VVLGRARRRGETTGQNLQSVARSNRELQKCVPDDFSPDPAERALGVLVSPPRFDDDGYALSTRDDELFARMRHMVKPEWHVCRHTLEGGQPNQDTWIADVGEVGR